MCTELAAPPDADARADLEVGLELFRLGRLAEAVPPLERAAAALPQLPEPHVRLGTIAGLRQDTAAAATRFRTALAWDPEHVPALAGLAVLEEASGRLAQARALLARAAAVEPDEPELALGMARLTLAQGWSASAAAQAATMLARWPTHAGAARLFALALAGLPTAAALSQVAAHAAADPFAAGWPLAAACLHTAAGDPAAALAELQAAAALAPDHPEIALELGRALAAGGRAREAEALLRAAAAARPTDLDARNQLATVLWRLQRFHTMRTLLDQAIADFGPQPALLLNRTLALNAMGEQDAALASADAAVAAGGGRDALLNRLAVLPYHPRAAGAAPLLEAARAVARSLGPPPPALARPAAGPDRPLRIGLLSGGLGIHPVGWLTVAGIEALSPEFELAAYALMPRRDLLADRFRARCARWRDVGGLDDAAIARRIAEDEVDILLELGGYGEGGRPFVLHHRPAPVAIKWVGAQFGSLGLSGADHMLTDRWETPPGSEAHYTERLLRLPDGYVCYAPAPYAPAVAPPAAQTPRAGTPGAITFGCFNNLAKITPDVLQAWARILAALPEARLLLRTHALAEPETAAAMRRRLAAAGLPLERVRLTGGLPHAELLAAYAEIDIALDPFPYTGGLTTIEALWMGVPVVALAGDSFCARHSLSHLANLGLRDWAAETVDAYVALAIERARDLPALARLRAGLRERMRRSPLCDAPRFGRALGDAIRTAWRQACAGDRG